MVQKEKIILRKASSGIEYALYTALLVAFLSSGLYLGGNFLSGKVNSKIIFTITEVILRIIIPILTGAFVAFKVDRNQLIYGVFASALIIFFFFPMMSSLYTLTGVTNSMAPIAGFAMEIIKGMATNSILALIGGVMVHVIQYRRRS